MTYAKALRKLGSLLMVVLLLTSALCGCSKSNDTSTDESATQEKPLTVSEVLTNLKTGLNTLGVSTAVSEHSAETNGSITTYGYMYFDNTGYLQVKEENGNVIEIRGASSPSFFSSSVDTATMAELVAEVPAMVYCSDISTRINAWKKESPDQTKYSFTYDGWEYTYTHSPADPANEIVEMYIITMTRI